MVCSTRSTVRPPLELEDEVGHSHELVPVHAGGRLVQKEQRVRGPMPWLSPDICGSRMEGCAASPSLPARPTSLISSIAFAFAPPPVPGGRWMTTRPRGWSVHSRPPPDVFQRREAIENPDLLGVRGNAQPRDLMRRLAGDDLPHKLHCARRHSRTPEIRLMVVPCPSRWGQ